MATERKVGWVPIFGEFDVADGLITFKGKAVPVIPPANTPTPPATESPTMQGDLGLVLSSLIIGDGTISALVEFDEVTADTFCELAVSYDPNASRLATAGLGGGGWNLFAIREYGGPRTAGSGWWTYRSAGDRRNLKPGQAYYVEARFPGAIVTLHLDNVEVGTAEVLSPVGRGHIRCETRHTPASHRTNAMNFGYTLGRSRRRRWTCASSGSLTEAWWGCGRGTTAKRTSRT